MTKGKGTQIGTDTKPMILGKKRRSPKVNSQAYRDNFDNIFGKKERTCQEIADHEADKILTKKVFPSYLFRKGEKWTHVDKLGNIWYEDIKTTYSEQMQDVLEPIFKK